MTANAVKRDFRPSICTKCEEPPTVRDKGRLTRCGDDWLCSDCLFMNEEEDTEDIRNRFYNGVSMVGCGVVDFETTANPIPRLSVKERELVGVNGRKVMGKKETYNRSWRGSHVKRK